MHLETQVVDACRRLARKQFLKSPGDSFSMRIPGHAEMVFVSGLTNWENIRSADIHTAPLFATKRLDRLHAAVYRQREDAGAVTICSPAGAALLAQSGGALPTLFDEQARHIGPSLAQLADQDQLEPALLKKSLKGGANAVLIGRRLLCLGMTVERALFNAELYEKCARAYVIAKSAGRVQRVPWWVRLIANRRLFRNEKDAAAAYREGRIPQGLSAY